MKRLLALVSILKLKRMKAKPLKRHCIFQRDKNLSDRAAKEPDGFLKKIAIMAFNFSFIFPLKPGSLRAEKYSLSEMKNLNRLLELIHSNQGWKSKRDIRKQAKRTYPMFNGHSLVPLQSLLAFCFSSCGNTVLFWDERRIVLVKAYVLRFTQCPQHVANTSPVGLHFMTKCRNTGSFREK